MKTHSLTSTNQIPWKRAWITGAGRGIGAALAYALCWAGVDIYVSARTDDQLQRLKSDLRDAPGTIHPCALDICDVAQVNRLMSEWDRDNGWPDLVVFNAGTHDPFPASEFTAFRAMHLINTNLGGTLNCLEPVLRHFMQQNHGHIAVMASVAGYRGLPTAAAYGASKAALINLCEALHLDLHGTDVKLQVICPGFVRTPLTDKNEFKMPALMEPEEAAQRIIEGLTGNHFEITFPKRFVYWLKLLRLLPYNWYFGLVAKSIGTGKG